MAPPLVGAARIGIRLARTLNAHWRALAPDVRERLEPLAQDAKRQALELRGSDDRDAAERDLRAANETLAAAIVESAEGDPAVDEVEVRRLREELARELERLATAEIRASRVRTPHGRSP